MGIPQRLKKYSTKYSTNIQQVLYFCAVLFENYSTKIQHYSYKYSISEKIQHKIQH